MRDNILDNLKMGVAIIDKDFHLKYLNRYLRELLVKDETDFRKIQERFGNAFKCKNAGLNITCGTEKSCQSCDIAPLLKNMYEGKEGTIFDLEILSDRFKIRKKGKFELRGYPVYIEGEKFIQLEIHEVSEKKSLEKNLQIKKDSQKKLQIFLDKIEDFIFYLDGEEKIEYCNDSYLKFLGKSYEEVIGKTESQLVPQVMAEKCKKNTDQALENGTFFEEEELFGRWYQTFKGRIELEDGNVGILGVVRDITPQKTRELELKKKVYTDLLTGLYNRNFIEEKIITNSEYDQVSVIVIDVDDLKGMNDTHGHEAGDQMLKSVADIIRINVRKEDYAARMGGDEFLIVTHSDLIGAQKIAERILTGVREIKICDRYITISIGIGEKKREIHDINRVIKDADEALYYSKNSGKNTISFKG